MLLVVLLLLRLGGRIGALAVVVGRGRTGGRSVGVLRLLVRRIVQGVDLRVADGLASGLAACGEQRKYPDGAAGLRAVTPRQWLLPIRAEEGES